LRKSIKVAGNGSKSRYQLKPVLRMTDDSKSGSASGEGENGSVVCVYADGATKDADDSCENAITSTTVKNGQFKLAFLEPGTYDLRVFRNKTAVGDVDDVVVKAEKSEGNSNEGIKVKLP
jgi:hypothetical protein